MIFGKNLTNSRDCFQSLVETFSTQSLIFYL